MLLFASGYLEFWHAIIIDLGSLIVVVVNGVQVLNLRTFSKYSGAVQEGEKGNASEVDTSEVKVALIAE